MTFEPLDEKGRADYDRSAMINDIKLRMYALEEMMRLLGEKATETSNSFTRLRDQLSALELDESTLPPETEF